MEPTRGGGMALSFGTVLLTAMGLIFPADSQDPGGHGVEPRSF